MSSKKIGLAIIGTGMAAKPHALALNELKDDINVVGVFSRNKEKRENFSKNYNFNSFQDIDSIYDNPEVDMVDIITPPNQRLELVEQFSKHGKHILMEKPIERTLENAKSIVSICENNKVNLGIVFQHRFRKSSIKLKSLINENKFGQIFSAQINIPWWREQSYYDEPGRGTYKRDGGGVLISQAIHTLDLAISLLGDVKEVMVMAETTKFHKMESENFVTGGIKFKNSVIASLFASTSVFPGSSESIVLHCENATVKLEAGTLIINWRNGENEEFGEESGTGGSADPMAFPFDWHKDLIYNFAKSISTNKKFEITGKEALKVHYLIDAMIESSKKNKLITME